MSLAIGDRIRFNVREYVGDGLARGSERSKLNSTGSIWDGDAEEETPIRCSVRQCRILGRGTLSGEQKALSRILKPQRFDAMDRKSSKMGSSGDGSRPYDGARRISRIIPYDMKRTNDRYFIPRGKHLGTEWN